MRIRIHKIIYDTTAEGFGHRACIWVQGCHRHCPGCMAQDTWDPEGGTWEETGEILSKILEQDHLEGITLLGGEPFEQAEALAKIAWECRGRQLSVIAFTGYTLEELQTAGQAGVRSLLGAVDLLIDGPYEQERRDFGRPWAGSSNQRFCFLTDRYGRKDLAGQGNRLEIRIKKDGTMLINGMSDFEQPLKEEQDGTI